MIHFLGIHGHPSPWPSCTGRGRNAGAAAASTAAAAASALAVRLGPSVTLPALLDNRIKRVGRSIGTFSTLNIQGQSYTCGESCETSRSKPLIASQSSGFRRSRLGKSGGRARFGGADALERPRGSPSFASSTVSAGKPSAYLSLAVDPTGL